MCSRRRSIARSASSSRRRGRASRRARRRSTHSRRFAPSATSLQARASGSSSSSPTARRSPSPERVSRRCFASTRRSTPIFVQFWHSGERVFTRGAPEPQYRADPSARAVLEGLAASIGGSVYGEGDVKAASAKATTAARIRAHRRPWRPDRAGSPRAVQRRRRARAARRSSCVVAIADVYSRGVPPGTRSRRLPGTRSRPCTRSHGSRARRGPRGSHRRGRRARPRHHAAGLHAPLRSRGGSGRASGRPDRRRFRAASYHATPAARSRMGPTSATSRAASSVAMLKPASPALIPAWSKHFSLPSNEMRSRTSQHYDPALDHGARGIWVDSSTTARLDACRPVDACSRPPPDMASNRRRPLGWREYMRKRSILLLTGLVVLVASLVIGPSATATTDRPSAGTVDDHSRPGAGDPQPLPR